MRRIREKKAFALMELLIVIAIVVVLAAVSIPNIVSMSSGIKMTELDNHAKTIFLAAQNQMTAKKAEGSLDDFVASLETTYSSQKLSTAPTDYDEDAYGTYGGNMYYLNASDLLIDDILPDGDALYGGDYLIEFNPESGDVYGVFYCENSVSYDDVKTLDRGVDARKAKKIGYYGGSIDTTALNGFVLGKNVELINSEELYVKISYDYSSVLFKDYKSALTTKVTVTGETSGKEWTHTFDWNATPLKTEGGKLEANLLLDSMISGKTFADITSGSGLVPGEKISVKVVSTFNNGTYNQELSVTVSGNSLFAEKSGSDISIATVRHLRNLDDAYYNTAGAVNVKLTSDIDFESDDYAWSSAGSYMGEGAGTRPVSAFTPISNDSIFKSGATLDGNGNIIKNFVIEGTSEGTGIFKEIKNTAIEDIELVDTRVEADGKDYVGTFAGKITGGTVKNCGVYLSTKNADNTYYSEITYAEGIYGNRMEERYDVYKVKGSSYVGGFCGQATGVDISNSFAAIKVGAVDYVGGFCGVANSGTKISNSYSSGEITATNNVGGFIGYVDGSTAAVVVDTCYSTSDVLAADSTTGGFVGVTSSSTYKNCQAYGKITNSGGGNLLTGAGAFNSKTTDDTFTDCAYLKQDSYNIGLADPDPISPKFYYEMMSSEHPSAGNSHPYNASLLRDAFPFKAATSSNTHYGDWPEQYTVETSIAYYEKYSDGTYGYYCMTTASGVDGLTSGLTWVLDTLKDEACVDDGYALITVYNLSGFEYILNIGSVNSEDATHTKNGEVTVSTSEGTGKAVILRQQSELIFKGYSGSYRADEDFSGKTPVNQFSVTGMYVYRLPDELQGSDREDVDNFYDRLTVYDAMVSGNPDPVIDGLSFYYCPNFAKAVINPGILHAGTDKPDNPSTVYVRSARQLNNLGRYSYYWNSSKGYTDEINFVQETDVDFKEYEASFTGTSENKPIGASGAHFTHNYDGRYNKIIDYCLSDSSNQYVGLFGVINGSKIENIVMTVSAAGNGKINGKYTGSGATTVGTLVGLSYLTDNVISNCAVSGYDVKYVSPGSPIARSIAVGGLVGISMGDITNCSAACNVATELNGAYTNSISMGGLAGSVYYGTTKNSYAGGNISIAAADNVYFSSVNDIAGGGIAGAVLKVANDVASAGTTTLQNLYSYTTISLGCDLDRGSGKQTIIAPIMGRVVLDTADNSAGGANVNASNIVMTNCYYLNDIYEELSITPTHKEAAVAKAYEDLIDLTISGMGSVYDATYTFPISASLAGKTYPYPATIKNADGKYVHYGDWVSKVAVTILPDKMPTYYELYKDGTYGLYYIDSKENIKNSLSNTADVDVHGYGIFMETKTGDESLFVREITVSGKTYYLYNVADLPEVSDKKVNVEYNVSYQADILNDGVKVGETTVNQTWYINSSFGAAVSMDDTLGLTEDNPLQVRTAEQFMSMNNLLNQNDYRLAPYLKQTRDLDLNGATDSVDNSWLFTYDGGSLEGYKMLDSDPSTPIDTIFRKNSGESTIKNVHVEGVSVDLGTDYEGAGFIGTNQGVITNCVMVNSSVTGLSGSATGFIANNYTEGVVEDCGIYSDTGYAGSTIEGYQAFGFAISNGGKIENCFVNATIIGENFAAGFIQKNQDNTSLDYEIENCYTNCMVIAKDTNPGMAYGFAADLGTSEGTIRSCYSAGIVQGNYAFGFLNDTNAVYCYSVAVVIGKAASFGFGGKPSSGTLNIDECYWGSSSSHNNSAVIDVESVVAGKNTTAVGTEVSLADIVNLAGKVDLAGEERFGEANTPGMPYDYSLSNVYPYPAVNDRINYGNWPTVAGGRNDKVINSDYVGLFYYEKYAEGEYGIYALGYRQNYALDEDWTIVDGYIQSPEDPVEVINTLATSGTAVLKSGYGVFYANTDVDMDYWYYSDVKMNTLGEAVSILTDGYSGIYTFLKTGDGEPNMSGTIKYENALGVLRKLDISLSASDYASTRPAE